MTLPASGPISLNDVNVELTLSGTTTISLNQTNVRALAGVPSGAISMSNLYGKQYRVALNYTFTTNTANATLNLNSISGYLAGASDITITVNTGIYLYATSVLNSGLALTGGTAGDTLTIVNNGFILGQGGSGGDRGVNTNGSPGAPGGPALSIPIPATINNTNPVAYIAGGGGGGAGGRGGGPSNYNASGGGGGAGGGNAGLSTGRDFGNIAGGAGGGIGAVGANASPGFAVIGSGGGGRILPGVGGTSPYFFPAIDPYYGGPYNYDSQAGSGGGAGGAGGTSTSSISSKRGATSPGRNGGSANNAGVSSGPAPGPAPFAWGGGGGGGWGASGGATTIPAGTGGSAVTLNGNTVTWTSGNTTRVYGAVS
jgi:hypothetical protein